MSPGSPVSPGPGARRARTVWIAAAVCLLTAALVAATLLLDIQAHPREGLSLRMGRLSYVGLALPTALIGGVIVTHRPGNRIGVLTIAAGVLIAVDQCAFNYFRHGHARALPFVETAGLVGNAVWVCPMSLLLWALLLYPDGRLPSRRWRPLAWAITGWSVLVAVLAALGAGIYGGPPLVRLPWSDGLFGPGRALERALPALFAMFAPLLAVAALSVLMRLRRASGEARAQIKWLAFASSTVAAMWSAPPVHETGSWGRVTANLALWTVPAAIGVAVMRYRLYDIDRIINHTLVYGVLTACVGGLYILVVAVLGALFEQNGIGASVAVATVVALLAVPVRARVQRGVDRLLYGRRGEPYAVVSELGRRLSAALAPDAVLPLIVDTVAGALKLPYVAIELTDGDGDTFRTASTHGSARAGPPVRIPLAHHGELLGRMVLGPRSAGEEFSPAELRLLHDLARQAGLALHSVRLTEDLQRSREQLVTAREEERRRLRHDLHDGLGPTLAGVAYRIDGARFAVADDDEIAGLLAALSTEIRRAIAEIRRLVDGLGSPALDELGLLRAIETRAALLGAVAAGEADAADDSTAAGVSSGRGSATGAIAIAVHAPRNLPRLPAAIEVAAYRIVTEALSNVVRHSGAARCRVAIALAAGGGLDIEITDDGRGLPDRRGLAGGVGLASMRERAAELGGSLTVECLAAGGTRVSAHLPPPWSWRAGSAP